MTTISEIFDIYRAAGSQPRGRWLAGKVQPRTYWPRAPIWHLLDDPRAHIGLPMVKFPRDRRIPGINPALIDRLQHIYYQNAFPFDASTPYRKGLVRIIDMLQADVENPDAYKPPEFFSEIPWYDKLVRFNDDPTHDPYP